MFNMLNRVGARSRAASLATPMIPSIGPHPHSQHSHQHHGPTVSAGTHVRLSSPSPSPSSPSGRTKSEEGTTSPSSLLGASPPTSPLRISSSSPKSNSTSTTVVSPTAVFSRSASLATTTTTSTVTTTTTPPRAPSHLSQMFEVLKGNNERELEAAGKALLNMTGTTNLARRTQVVDHAAFPRVVQLLSEGPSRTRILMTAVVSNLATTSDDIRTKLVLKGVVAPLVANLSSQNHSVQQISMQATCNLAAGSGRTAIVEEGGIARIVEVLRAGAEECKPHAVGALNNLSSLSDEAKTAIFEAGAVPLLVNVLQSGGHESRERAAYTLWNLSSVPHIRSHLFSIGAAKHVVMQLTCPDHGHSMSPRSSPVSALADSAGARRRRAASISS